jgi:lysozyme family protein
MAAVKVILGEEGGYTPGLPDDPGGETNFGISKRSYPNLNIFTLTEAEAIAIYHRDYWDSINLSAIPQKVALLVLDSAVNQGVGTAARILQAALGVAQDGVVGPATARAAWGTAPTPLMIAIAAQRAIHYAQAPNFKTWGGAWMRRLVRVYTAALVFDF